MNYAKENGCSSATLQKKGGRAAGTETIRRPVASQETVCVPMDADLKRALDAVVEAQLALHRWEEAIDGTDFYELRYSGIDACSDKLDDAARDLMTLWTVQYLLDALN